MKTMRMSVCLLLSLGTVYAGEIYKWTDENGKVHFSDIKPATKANVEPVDMKLHRPSEQDRKEAQARALKEKALLNPPAEAASEQAQARSMPSAVTPNSKRERCEAQWKQYRDSAGCFERFRLDNGGLHAEAYQQCVEVKTPERCE